MPQNPSQSFAESIGAIPVEDFAQSIGAEPLDVSTTARMRDLTTLSLADLVRSGAKPDDIRAELTRREHERTAAGAQAVPTVMGGIGGALGGVPGAAIGGMAGEAVRQAALGTDDPTVPDTWRGQAREIGLEAFKQGAFQGIGNAVVGGASRAANWALRKATPWADRALPGVSSDALGFARANDIPLDAATATQSPAVGSVQKAVSDNLGGAGVAERFKAGQQQRLADVGERLAQRTGSGPASAESAGQGVLGQVEQTITGQHAAATAAYGRLRAIEQQAPIAVELASVKTGLKPLYQQLMRERAITGTLNGAKARATVALDNLMHAPDRAPLSVVDGALSDLKALARGSDLPELRNATQSTAAQAVKQLDASVRNAAMKAGPQAIKALEEGRAATTAKYIAADVRDALMAGTSGEPVKVFNRLTGRDDTAINLLRSVQQEAPQALPSVGRAVLDDLMQTGTADGGFGKAATLLNQWRKLGPETKALLFPDAVYRKNLDNFFQLAKLVGDNPNPSGTSRVLNATKVTAALPSWAVAKLLYSPTGVSLMTRGLMVPSRSDAGAALTAQMLQLAGRNAGWGMGPDGQ